MPKMEMLGESPDLASATNGAREAPASKAAAAERACRREMGAALMVTEAGVVEAQVILRPENEERAETAGPGTKAGAIAIKIEPLTIETGVVNTRRVISVEKVCQNGKAALKKGRTMGRYSAVTKFGENDGGDCASR